MSFVCIRCGATFEHKRAPGDTPSLNKHWAGTGHGPGTTQSAAIERAKENVIQFPKK